MLTPAAGDPGPARRSSARQRRPRGLRGPAPGRTDRSGCSRYSKDAQAGRTATSARRASRSYRAGTEAGLDPRYPVVLDLARSRAGPPDHGNRRRDGIVLPALAFAQMRAPDCRSAARLLRTRGSAQTSAGITPAFERSRGAETHETPPRPPAPADRPQWRQTLSVGFRADDGATPIPSSLDACWLRMGCRRPRVRWTAALRCSTS
jgi:hypothetical protein